MKLRYRKIQPAFLALYRDLDKNTGAKRRNQPLTPMQRTAAKSAKQTSATGPTKVQFGIKLQNLTMFRYIKIGTAFRTTFHKSKSSNPL